jgi:hypothetical protein
MPHESDTVNKPLLPTEPGPRRCLKCNEEFPSKGAGNRICKKCTQVNASLKISEAQIACERGAKRLNGLPIEEQSTYSRHFVRGRKKAEKQLEETEY